MNRKIREQRAFVKQLRDALEFYRDDKNGHYGDKAGLIRTCQDCVDGALCKLAEMERRYRETISASYDF